jgi:hypothetical protein
MKKFTDGMDNLRYCSQSWMLDEQLYNMLYAFNVYVLFCVCAVGIATNTCALIVLRRPPCVQSGTLHAARQHARAGVFVLLTALLIANITLLCVCTTRAVPYMCDSIFAAHTPTTSRLEGVCTFADN